MFKGVLTMRILAIISFILFFITCSSRSVNENTPSQEIWEIPDSKNLGFLKVKFVSSENLTIKNYSLRISKIFPETQYESIWTSAILIPMLIYIPKNALVHDNEYLHQNDLKVNEANEYVLPAGEYYVSIDTSKNANFSFDPIESQQLLFSFGYQHQPNAVRSKTSEYNSDCISYYTGKDNVLSSFNSSSCAKLVIKQNQISEIEINISDRKRTSMVTWLYKLTIGLIQLAPFTNRYGTYYYRDYNVELKNPSEHSPPKKKK